MKVFVSVFFIISLITQNAVAGVGKISDFKPPSYIERGSQRIEIKTGMGLEMGDVIVTGKGGFTKIILNDESLVSLSEDTGLKVDDLLITKTERRGLLSLIKGRIRCLVIKFAKISSSFNVQTGSAVVGVRGTEFLVNYNPEMERIRVDVLNGIVFFRNILTAIEQEIRENQFSEMEAQQPPSPPRDIPQDELNKIKEEIEKGAGDTEQPATDQKKMEEAIRDDTKELPEGVKLEGEKTEEKENITDRLQDTEKNEPERLESGDTGIKVRW